MNYRLILRAFVALSLWFAGVSYGQTQDADARLNAFVKDYLEGWFRLRPLEATRLGDHRYDNLIENLAPESRAAWLEYSRKALNDVSRQFAANTLSRSAQIDLEIFQHQLNYDIWLDTNTHPFEEDPRVYGDYINDGVYVLLTQSTAPKEANIANCIARMALIPRIVARAKENLRNPPRVHTETAIRQNRGAIEFFEHDIFEFAGRTKQLSELKAAAAEVVPTLKDYQRFLEQELLPRANGDWRLGSEKFARKFEFEMDAGVSADQVLTNAETEFARVQRDMYVVARQAWSKYFPKRALPPDDDGGRRATVKEVLDATARDHGQASALTGAVKRRVSGLKRFIKETDFVHLPEPDRCQVVEMPEFRRGNAVAYMEAAPPLDRTANAHLAISPPPADWDAERINSYLQEYNNHMLDILAIHEGYPGHAVQLAYANANPSLVRRVFGSGPYIEGWAVYTEQTMLDQGYGGGDLALRLNQLKFYLRAVANAILDHRMHYGTMTDEQALDFLTRQCFQSDGEARLKIIRAKQSSVQLSTYFVGRMAHCRLRQEIERAMGDKFALGRYHEAVLDPGAVPMKYLSELVRAQLGITPK